MGFNIDIILHNIIKKKYLYFKNILNINKLNSMYNFIIDSYNSYFILIVKIENSNIYYYKNENQPTFFKTNTKNLTKKIHYSRVINILNMLHKTIIYMKKNNINIPNTFLFFTILDTVTNLYNDYPFISISQQITSKGFLRPDFTFNYFYIPESVDTSFFTSDKYKPKVKYFYTWDQQKKLINNYSKNIKYKRNIIYFKGSDTSGGKSNIRCKLDTLSKKFKFLELDMNIKHYVPIYELCNYKFLLNLPGFAPWSVRLKYLPLMKSPLININLKRIIIYDNKEIIIPNYISFINYILIKNKDYYNINYECYEYKNNYKSEIKKKKIQTH